MKGWIEVHNIHSNNHDHKRLFQVSLIRWIGADNKDRKNGAICTMGDDFIYLTREPYEKLWALIEASRLA